MLGEKKLKRTGISRISPVLFNSCNPQYLKPSATFIKTKINNQLVHAILDSGAVTSLISLKLTKKLNINRICKEEINTNFIAANGEKLKTLGYCLIEINIGQIKIRQKCIIIDKLATDLLLGTDILVTHGMIINYLNKTLSVGKLSTTIYTEEKINNYCLAATTNIIIPAQSLHTVLFKIPDEMEGTVLLENTNLSSYYTIKEGLYEINNHNIPIIFTNNNRFAIEISKGKYLADIESITSAKINLVSSNNIETRTPSQMKDKVKTSSELTIDQNKKLNNLIQQYEENFSQNNNDLGFYDKQEFEIDTGNEKPIKTKPYRVPYAQQPEVDSMIDEMLENKIISKSNSPWASPLVIVKKKDGTNRFCVDYRKLNNITTKDNFPVPLIEETLDSLNGSCFFSSIDLCSGYWQMALDNNSKLKTAFISSKGLFHFERLPFGLSNAVAYFQRTMETILEGLPFAKVYIDDILVHSKTFEEHLVHLEEVFKRLREANLKIKPSKCLFGSNQTTFLGYDINIQGIKPNNEKIKAMLNYPAPKNQKQVKRFLGLASYYRKFIPNYSSITEPINKLLKKNEKFVWSIKCEKNFKLIIYYLTNPPLLAFPDFKKDFFLQTDASGVGLGAVLVQLDDENNERVLGYASRLLKDPERNYHATELECLAIVWATEHFRPYLYGRKFKIYSDHNPLVHIKNIKNKSARVTRWKLSLAEYDYEIEYKKGSLNSNADALSRIESEAENTNIMHINNVLSSLLPENIIEAQSTDDFSNKIIKNIENESEFILENNILFRKTIKGIALVVPTSLRETALRMCHNDMGGGHLGVKKTWPKLRDRFFWPNMYNDTDCWIKSCATCSKKKTPKQITKIAMHPIDAPARPFEMLGVDIVGPLPETAQGNKYIIVFTDYLTRWPEAFPIKKIDAKTVAKIFVNEIIARHSAPSVLLSDQGAQFMSILVKETCDYLLVNKINTTAYHPQTNGLTEKFNGTLCQILSIYGNEKQSNWDEMIPTALFAYRTSIQETTLQTPFETLYSRSPRLPNNLEKIKSNNTFVKDYSKNWEEARERINKVNQRRKTDFDSKFKRKIINIGDNVRLHIEATKVGLKKKLRGEMYAGPFKVIGKLPNGNLKLNIYKKKPYITHPDRVKLAETNFHFWENEKGKMSPSKKKKKKVSFSDIIAEYFLIETS